MFRTTVFLAAVTLCCGCLTPAPPFDVKFELAPEDVLTSQQLGIRCINEHLLDLKRHVEGEYEPFTGRAFAYWPNGAKKLERNYRNGSMEGPAIFWNRKGQKTSEKQYVDGKNDGEWRDWYDNGQLEHVWCYRNGKKHGLYEGWHENGQKNYEWHYNDDTNHGSSVGWHENGQKEYELDYVCGQRQGRQTVWHKNGRKKAEGSYVDGKLEGSWTEWHENGVKALEIPFKAGKRSGRFQQWDEKGRNMSDAIYELCDRHLEMLARTSRIEIHEDDSILVLSDPDAIDEIISALKLEPYGPRNSCGCMFEPVTFVTDKDEHLILGSSSHVLFLETDEGSLEYLPLEGLMKLIWRHMPKKKEE